MIKLTFCLLLSVHSRQCPTLGEITILVKNSKFKIVLKINGHLN